MRTPRPRRPSPSMVVALLALFAALGGTSLAATLITGRDVRDGSLTGRDIRRGSITGRNIRNGTLTGAKLRANTVTGRQISESSLGEVPSAGDAARLGGQPASAYERAHRWVLVQGTATGANVLAQSGGFAAQRLATGVYSIDAGGSISGRPLTATLNLAGGNGFVNAAPCGGTANNPGGFNCPGVNDTSRVLVSTQTVANAPADRTFYLTIGP